MKKYLSIGLILFLSAGLVYQWLRADVEADILEARIAGLQRDLYRIDKLRSQTQVLDKEITMVDNHIASLQKRLPPETGKDAFVKELIERFNNHTFEATLQSSATEDKDFYKEIQLQFYFKESAPDVALLREIFKDMERLAQWEYTRDKVLITRIFSSLLEMKTTVIKPYKPIDRKDINYWPFHSMVRERAKLLDESLSKRDQDRAIFIKIKQLENRRRFAEPLGTIVAHLAAAIEKEEVTSKKNGN